MEEISKNFIENFIDEDLAEGGRFAGMQVHTRFPPEPNGYLHIGHCKALIIDFGTAEKYGGICNLRMDDTNPAKEDTEYVDAIQEDIHWLGFDWGDRFYYGSDYFERTYEYALELIKKGLAYVCELTPEQFREYRGDISHPAVSPWRDRPIEDIKAALAEGKPWVLRFRSEGSIENKIKVTDLIKGTLELTENDIDHVLLKSDGIPTYHFAHAVDDHLMRTTHVVRGDEWLPSLPFHIQLFASLGWKCPKYMHIGPLMKMDGDSKRKLSKRKDPELALTYYRGEGFPTESVYEYLMGVLNSNFEDWRRANPDASVSDFKFSYKKMNPAGSLFDYAKLCDVSKNVISRMSAEDVYAKTLDWADEYDSEFAAILRNNKERAVAAFAIGRGGKKPRKDITVWKDARDYIGFMFKEDFRRVDTLDEKFDRADVKAALTEFIAGYDPADEQQVWFDKIKDVAKSIGYCPDMKEYKADPDAYPGSVADVSMFLRLAVTGKLNSPDMYEVMKILGREETAERINHMAEEL